MENVVTGQCWQQCRRHQGVDRVVVGFGVVGVVVISDVIIVCVVVDVVCWLIVIVCVVGSNSVVVRVNIVVYVGLSLIVLCFGLWV